MYFKVGLLKDFANFTKKHLLEPNFKSCRPKTAQVISFENCEVFNNFFTEHFRWLLLNQTQQ